MPSTIAEYAEAVARLDEQKRRRFYETLALNLTVSARVVWSDDTLSDSEKVEQLRQLNEKQHRLIGKLLATHPWSDIDFVNTFLSISECKSVAGHLGWAVKQSLECVTKNTAEV